VEALKQSGEMRLWPEIKKQSNRWGHYPSKDCGTFKRRLGLVHEKKVFHSFRHNFQNNLKHNMVPPPHN
jgi:hypothetical protein